MIPLANLKRNIRKAFEQPFYALKVLIRRGMNYLYYKVTGGRSFSPDAITIFLTYLCNLRCKMCGQWGEAGAFKDFSKEVLSEQLDFNEMKKMIDRVAFFKPSITFFGGEPLLGKDFTKIFEYVKEKGLHCLLITNVTILKDYVGLLVDKGLDELNISIDGPGSIHDQIRGVPGLFNQIKEGIECLNAYKEKTKKKKPLIHIEFTITKYNIDHMLAMVDVAREFRAQSLSFHHLIFLNPQIYQKQEEVFSSLFCASSYMWKGFVLDAAGVDVEKLATNIEILKGIKQKGLNIEVYPNIKKEELKAYYTDPNFIPSGYGKRCLSPWMTCYVFPDGSVRPCLDMEYSVGNIREKPFLEIWNSKDFMNYRKILKERRTFPACVRCSELYRY